MKKLTRKICPKCKSSYISLWMGAELGIVYQCQECGYRGPVVIEEDISNRRHSKKRK